MPEPLSLDDVRHIARLARLQLGDEELDLYREQLSKILEHAARLGELQLDGVEPMARPVEVTNRLDDDEVAIERMLPGQTIAENAPLMEGRFIAVPKVLGEGAG